MDWRAGLIVAASAWIGWAILARRVAALRPRGDDMEAALLLALIRALTRFVHRLRVEGSERLPPGRPSTGGEPLVIVANHASGADPILIQAALPFEVRWIMARDMRAPALERLWEFARIIFVDRRDGGSNGLREALRHLRKGGVVGVFPEGFIERPARALLPFQEGVGLLIARSGAGVLPVVIEGAPEVDPAWAALLHPSRSRLRFLPIWRPGNLGRAEIGRALRRLFQEATGWPLCERRTVYRDGEWWTIDPDRGGGYVPASEIENR